MPTQCTDLVEDPVALGVNRNVRCATSHDGDPPGDHRRQSPQGGCECVAHPSEASTAMTSFPRAAIARVPLPVPGTQIDHAAYRSSFW